MVVTRGGLDGMKLAGQDASVGGGMRWLEDGGGGRAGGQEAARGESQRGEGALHRTASQSAIR